MFAGKCSCIHCKEVKSASGLTVHIDRIHLGSTKYSSGNNGNYALQKEQAAVVRTAKQTQYYLAPRLCLQCNTAIEWSKKVNKFCNSNCAATYENARRKSAGWKRTEESKRKVSETITGLPYEPLESTNPCVHCGTLFTSIRNGKKRARYCSKHCSGVANGEKRSEQVRPTRSALTNYRADCAFKFGIKDYPTEFDFALIEQHGWYKPKNRGDNLYGVSRDHIVSVRYGFDNNLPAEHLAHPANCRLMRHHHNVSKGVNNHITYDELLVRIAEWDQKYSS